MCELRRTQDPSSGLTYRDGPGEAAGPLKSVCGVAHKVGLIRRQPLQAWRVPTHSSSPFLPVPSWLSSNCSDCLRPGLLYRTMAGYQGSTVVRGGAASVRAPMLVNTGSGGSTIWLSVSCRSLMLLASGSEAYDLAACKTRGSGASKSLAELLYSTRTGGSGAASNTEAVTKQGVTHTHT